MTQPGQPTTVGNALKLAHQHLEARRLADAELIYRQILEVNPNHFDALHYLGVIALQVRKYDKAVELISRAVEQNPASYAAHNNLGISYLQQGKLTQADLSFQRALAIKPDYPQAKINRARICQKLGDHATGLDMALQGTGFTRFTSAKVKLIQKLPLICLFELFELVDACRDPLLCLACV
jgi:tetratricopeptide (TPR) repeat protein